MPVWGLATGRDRTTDAEGPGRSAVTPCPASPFLPRRRNAGSAEAHGPRSSPPRPSARSPRRADPGVASAGGTMTMNDLPPTAEDEPALLAWLATMRDEHPVWRDGYGMWHVFRHDDVEAILRAPATFSSDPARLVPAAAPVRRGMLTQIDPPEHRALRRLVSATFTPRMVAGLEPRVRSLTGHLLDEAGERFDLVDALAFPLPVIVIAELLGLPADDRPLFRTWADGLFNMQVGDPNDPDVGPKVAAAMSEIIDYLLRACRARRAEPRDDLISALVTTEVEGRVLDDEEAANFSMLLLLAGHITTTVLLGNAVRTFDENPGVWPELRAEPALIPGAIEEVLR